jgi:hypothetical protein
MPQLLKGRLQVLVTASNLLLPVAARMTHQQQAAAALCKQP